MEKTLEEARKRFNISKRENLNQGSDFGTREKDTGDESNRYREWISEMDINFEKMKKNIQNYMGDHN